MTKKTNSIGQGRAAVSTTVKKEVAQLIVERAEAIDWSPTKFARAIIEGWFNAGAPPVSDVDQAMIAILKSREDDGSNKNPTGSPVMPSRSTPR